jgi:glyoxylase-like metal-dependent hydrolase (beta-lactamase superfamily II)
VRTGVSSRPAAAGERGRGVATEGDPAPGAAETGAETCPAREEASALADAGLADRLDADLRRDTVSAHRWLWGNFTEMAQALDGRAEGDSLVFLDNPMEGVAEPPVVTRLANGFVVRLGDLAMMVDPGPDALSRCLSAGVVPSRVNAVYVSHAHVDHYAGAESVIEEMCLIMLIRRGRLLVSPAVAEAGCISAFHQGRTPRGGPETTVVQPGVPVALGDATLTPVPMYHPGGGCGFVLERDGLRIGYTGDTSYVVSYRDGHGVQQMAQRDNFEPIEDLLGVEAYREDLKQAYGGVDLLIANVGGHAQGLRAEMSSLGLAHLLSGSRVKLCLITHFLRGSLYPTDMRQRMADYIQARSGVRTVVATSRFRLPLPWAPVHA